MVGLWYILHIKNILEPFNYYYILFDGYSTWYFYVILCYILYIIF